jgi:hypothetical protein
VILDVVFGPDEDVEGESDLLPGVLMTSGDDTELASRCAAASSRFAAASCRFVAASCRVEAATNSAIAETARS